MVRFLRWLGLLVTVAFKTILGAAGAAGSGGGGGGTETRIERAPSTFTSADFTAGIYGKFEPDAATELVGLADANQDSGKTLIAAVYEDGNTTALATTSAVSQVSGEHVARFSSPVSLSPGTVYRIGWSEGEQTGHVKATETSGTWSGFTLTGGIVTHSNNGGSPTYPTSSTSGWYPTFDILIQE